MLSRKIPVNLGQYVRRCHIRSKLLDQIVAGMQAVGVRPWICELVYPVDLGRQRKTAKYPRQCDPASRGCPKLPGRTTVADRKTDPHGNR